MTVHHSWVGGSTATGMRLSTRTSSVGSLRWVVSTSSLLTSPVYSSPVAPDSAGLSKHLITGLTAGTAYFYGLEADGVLLTETASRGQFTTLPADGSEASFSFWFGGDRNHTSNHAVYDAIRARNPLFGLFLGDLGYTDPQTATATESLWQTSLAQPRFAQLVRDVPTSYTYDNHDYAGAGSWPGHVNGPTAQAYARAYPAHHPLPADGLYGTWRVGRCKFIWLDTRSLRSNPADADSAAKSVLGPVQKAWFKAELAAATEPLIFVALSFPHRPFAVPDRWGQYPTEYAELNAYIATIPDLAGKLVWLHADMHVLAADDGTNSPNGSVQLVGAPLDQVGFDPPGGGYFNSASWSEGWHPNPVGVGQYGWVTITDAGSHIQMAFRGYDDAGVAQVAFDKVFTPVVPGAPVVERSAHRESDLWSRAKAKVLEDGDWKQIRIKERRGDAWH